MCLKPASQSFFIHSCIYLRIFIISYLATFLGTNSLSVLMCRKAINQSINQPSPLILKSSSPSPQVASSSPVQVLVQNLSARTAPYHLTAIMSRNSELTKKIEISVFFLLIFSFSFLSPFFYFPFFILSSIELETFLLFTFSFSFSSSFPLFFLLVYGRTIHLAPPCIHCQRNIRDQLNAPAYGVFEQQHTIDQAT